MDANGKASAKAETDGMERGGAEMVLMISAEEETTKASRIASSSFTLKALETSALQEGLGNSNSGFSEFDTPKSRVQSAALTSFPSPETVKSSPNVGKPPKIPVEALTRRVSLSKSALSKPKSRFVEPSVATATAVASVEQKSSISQDRADVYPNSPNRTSPINNVVTIGSSPTENVKTAPVTPKTPLIASTEEDDEDEEIYKTENVPAEKQSSRNKKMRILVTIESIGFICTLGGLIASLAIPKLKNLMPWGLELWKWFVLAMVILCGRLFSEWFINLLVMMIERNFLLKKKVLYFVYGLKKSVQVFLWLGLVLLAWALLFNRGVKRSKEATKVLNYVSRALISCLVGAAIWLVKALLLKLLASSFHVSTFFDRIQESICHQYILKRLSGPPVMEYEDSIRSARASGQSPCASRV